MRNYIWQNLLSRKKLKNQNNIANSDTQGAAVLSSQEWHALLTRGKTVQALANRIKSKKCADWCQPLLENSSPADSMIELGSGTGELSAILAIQGRIAHLLDYSAKNIDFTKQLFQELALPGNFYVQDVLKGVPLATNSIDWVWSSGLLEHFSDEQITKILGEAYRVCRKGVMSLVPNANAIFYRIGKFRMEQENRWPYGKETTKFTMKHFFKDVGLKNIIEYSFGIDDSLRFWGSGKQEIKGFFNSLSLEELNKLNQGYLLFTYGEK